MFFKNLAIYRLPADWQLSPIDLEEKLITRRLQPCGHFEMSSRGWVRVTADERLVHSVGRQQLIALGVEQKILPGSVIRQVALERAEIQAAEQGFAVGRKQLRDIKLKVTEELRARALTRRRVTRAWIDPEHGWFVVDAAGGARADELLETLRDTLGSFAVVPLDTERSPQASMMAWLKVDASPAPFHIDDELELKGVDKSRATIRYTHHPIDSAEVKEHLASGLFPTRLGLTWSDRIALVLTDKLQVKRLQFLELEADTPDGGDVDETEQFDIDFTVMAGELARLLADLATALQSKLPTQS
jgi:recombination associated protein RdgC